MPIKGKPRPWPLSGNPGRDITLRKDSFQGGDHFLGSKCKKGRAYLVLSIVAEIFESAFFALLLWIGRYIGPDLSSLVDAKQALPGNSFFMMAGIVVFLLRVISLFFGKGMWLEKDTSRFNGYIRAGFLFLLMTLACVSFCLSNYDSGLWSKPLSFVWVIALLQALLQAAFIWLKPHQEWAERILFAIGLLYLGYAMIGILL